MKNFKKSAIWRLLVVLYYAVYLPLPFILIVAFLDFGRSYHYSGINDPGYYTWNIGKAFIPIAIILLIYSSIVEIIRRAILYIIGIESLGIIGTIVKLNQEAEAKQNQKAELERLINPPQPYNYRRIFWIVGLTVVGFGVFILISGLIGYFQLIRN